ncbi:class I SAM-dependent methyltransferase [Microcella sp.]|uniref:class I SAM-dependent methyltransferase n=1 Tax=Microcella sp. TaxID=1913979 RepID=UPI00299F77E2|nr:methyltransferase [Microcella sp.]MDX2025020.1 methyltransferase [Microcella sp.]
MTDAADPALDALLGGLRRRPDVEAPELRAWDAADRYLLDTAAPLAHTASTVVVVDDTHGALTLGALTLGAQSVRVHQDSLVAQHALEANAGSLAPRIEQHPLESVMPTDAPLALLRLPRSLDRLDAVARHLAAHAHSDVVLIAGNMLKHMTPTQNEVLRASFERVDVSLARGKARLLTARGPRRVAPAEPARGFDPDHELHIVALPGVFAGASLDIGTRALLDAAQQLPAFSTAIDLACGSGVLAAFLARHSPGARVIASDVSAVAVQSAALTAEANGVRVETLHDNGLSQQPDASADLIMLNPPFHVGAAVHTGIALQLFADAARVLRPGGELWTVWNSHLAYGPALERAVGPTRQVARTPKFTVTASRRRLP